MIGLKLVGFRGFRLRASFAVPRFMETTMWGFTRAEGARFEGVQGLEA